MEHEHPDVSVIIVNYSNRDDLLKTLESLYQDPGVSNHEIIVVDNASDDDSVEAVGRDFPAVKVITLPENAGYAKANNRGAEEASGRFLLFLNNDTEVAPDTIGKILDIKKNHPEFGIVAPLVFYADGSLQLSWGRDLHLHSEVFLKFFAERWHRWRFRGKKRQMDRDVDWVSGACFLIERRLYHQVGGFDERFFLYIEDADLGKRIRQLGYKIHLTSQARIIHHLGQSVAKMSGRAMLEAKRSQLHYYCKHNSRAALAALRLYLRLRFWARRWMSRWKGDTQSQEICTRVLAAIKEFRCENPV